MCGYEPCARPDCTWGEQYRAECEARSVLAWPDTRRKIYYAAVKQKRGDAAARKLIDDVRKEWARKQK